MRAALARRLEEDATLGARLLAAGGVATALVVPMLLLFLAVQDRWPPLRAVDEGTAQRLNDVAVASPALVTFLQGVSAVFDPWSFRALGLVLVVVLARQRRDRLAVWVGVTIGGSGLVSGGAKLLFGRDRPVLDTAVASAPGLSFPSGHALGSIVGIGVLVLLVESRLSRPARLAAVVAAVLVVLTVGWSRVGLGVHFVSDVLAGWLLGGAWLAATTIAFAVRPRRSGAPAGP